MSRFCGVDVGTGNVANCESSSKTPGEYHSTKERDMFFKMNPQALMQGGAGAFGENVLKKSGANYLKIDGILYILGESAFKFANLFHQECMRPMVKGVLNPNEPISAIMLKELIRGLVGIPSADADKLYYCTPANPIDADFDITYHSHILKAIFEELGYKNVYRMDEGLAVAYAELEDTNYSGLSISFGSGMSNLTYAYMGMPILSFSLTRGGDWIDVSAAKALSETANNMQMVKESGMDISNPKNAKEQAVAIYYNTLIEYVIKKFVELYEKADKKTLPNINAPISIVLAGGTSMVKGFTEKFSECVKHGFPLPVKEIREASDPMFAVARGLCKASEQA